MSLADGVSNEDEAYTLHGARDDDDEQLESGKDNLLLNIRGNDLDAHLAAEVSSTAASPLVDSTDTHMYTATIFTATCLAGKKVISEGQR